MNKLKNSIPFLVLAALLALLSRELFQVNKSVMPSVLIGEPVPSFTLQDVLTNQRFSEKDLPGRLSLVNVWATWCYACAQEHSMLMKIEEQYHVPIYGIVYKDDRQAVLTWLNKKGNPYLKVGDDNNGNAAIDFGVYGTPETFVISPQGKIIYRHVGAINQDVWDKTLYPLILRYSEKR